MYEAFFGLKLKPFSMLPDADFLVESDEHATVLSLLEYSVAGQAGFCVITGEIGCGKTTLIHAFLKRLGDDTTVGVIPNTHRSFRDISRWVLMSFDQKPVGQTPSETYQELMLYLIAEYGNGRRCLLVVDEAQNLTVEALEELRLLSNINSGSDLLLQIILVGQPELLETLKSTGLAQFIQRISVSRHLAALPLPETAQYIRRRLELAGADRALFTERAITAVHFFSNGIPRLINSLCDLALVYAFAEAQQMVDIDLVRRVVSDRKASGITLFEHLDKVDDPGVEAEITALSSGGGTADGAAAAPSPSIAEPATRSTQDDLHARKDDVATAPPEEKSVILVGVPYRVAPAETSEPADRVSGSDATFMSDTPWPSFRSEQRAESPHYLLPEIQSDWPRILGRAGIKRTSDASSQDRGFGGRYFGTSAYLTAPEIPATRVKT